MFNPISINECLSITIIFTSLQVILRNYKYSYINIHLLEKQIHNNFYNYDVLEIRNSINIYTKQVWNLIK